ncbi:helix-turn-helix domain-containing protein [Bifidobacterium mongoliense]|uniref:helix-turn-helix domain-containing protein n=1 Tax=Bifidobacterium mongoliense TaxID=518643 RepID=UPI002646FE7F|nr:helix-turn-helix transcriptional regulator [Bifidobacterium mongoliense]MDN5980002.1 helix-turn-helix domain-containing protein [Bifidobacterium mongoliense]
MQSTDNFTDKVIIELETARQEAGVTVQELIEKSGIRRSTYFRKMRGVTDFTTSDIDAIARALGVDPFLILRKAAAADSDGLTEDEKFAEAMRDAMNDPMALAALRSADKHKRGDKPADDGA